MTLMAMVRVMRWVELDVFKYSKHKYVQCRGFPVIGLRTPALNNL